MLSLEPPALASEGGTSGCVVHHRRRRGERNRWLWQTLLVSMGAALPGVFMILALGFGTLIEHPVSPVRQAVAGALPRELVGGLRGVLDSEERY